MALRSFLACVLVLSPWAAAQGTWTRCTPTSYPSPRAAHAMVFDHALGEALLFGGWDNKVASAETWSWNGARWLRHFPAQSPPARWHHAMAYDPTRKRAVLFGGCDPSTPMFNDTWEWDGSTWRRLFPAQAPPNRIWHAMAFDLRRGKVILYGGYNGAALGDMWEWDGVNWTPLAPPALPPARCAPGMAPSQAAPPSVLMFGGHVGNPTKYLNETWEWNGTTWTQLPVAAPPPPRACPAMCTGLSSQGRIALFGGGGPAEMRDMWAWNGAQWSAIAPPTAPSPRFWSSMIFAPAGSRLVLFGGEGPAGTYHGDTWEYANQANLLAALTPIGLGCSSSQGRIPSLSGPQPPRFNSSFRLDLANAPIPPPFTGSILCFDVADPNVDLGPFGAPNCTAHAWLNILSVVIPVYFTGTWSPAPTIPIPLDLSLLGSAFYSQAYILDARANALGVIATNGLKGVVGY